MVSKVAFGKVQVDVVRTGGLPLDARLLREQVYLHETGDLPASTLVSDNDHKGIHVAIRDADSRRLLAAATINMAEASDFPEHSGISAASLEDAIYLSRGMVDPSARGQGLFILLTYVCMLEGRRHGRRRMVSYIHQGRPAVTRILHVAPMQSVPIRHVRGAHGRGYRVCAVEHDIDFALDLCWRRLRPDAREVVADLLQGDMLLAVKSTVDRLLQTPWFVAIRERRLTSAQYVASLAAYHSYVRLTPRVLLQAALATQSVELRRAYALHAAHEEGHEALIEADLCHLGVGDAYLEYVKHMPPPRGALRFIALEESLAHHHEQGSAFLAVPLVVEGITARLKGDFMVALMQTIYQWGYEKPEQACSFMADHIALDGGQSGHFQQALQLAARHVRTDRDMKALLRAVAEVGEAFDLLLRDAMNPAAVRVQPGNTVALEKLAAS